MGKLFLREVACLAAPADDLAESDLQSICSVVSVFHQLR